MVPSAAYMYDFYGMFIWQPGTTGVPVHTCRASTHTTYMCMYQYVHVHDEMQISVLRKFIDSRSIKRLVPSITPIMYIKVR